MLHSETHLNRKSSELDDWILAVSGLPLGSIFNAQGHYATAAHAEISLPHFLRTFYFRGLSGISRVARFAFSLPDLAWPPRPQAGRRSTHNLVDRQRGSIMTRTSIPPAWEVSFSGSAQSPKTMSVAEGDLRGRKSNRTANTSEPDRRPMEKRFTP